MSDVTRIIQAIEAGDRQASQDLLPLVYEELRRLAQHRMRGREPGETLQATALVHEAFVRLVDQEQEQNWDSRGHFFSAAAEAMRRILIEQARKKARQKHGGSHQRVEMHESKISSDAPSDDLLAINEALNRLETEHPEKAQLIKLRYFAGLTLAEAAESMGISRATAARHWTFGRTWLFKEISNSSPED